MTLINPYNFVPLLSEEPIRTKWTGVTKHHRLIEGTYSGHLILRLHTITPVFIPSYSHDDVLIEPYTTPQGIKHKRTFKRFHYCGENPTIPSTSLKGMIRSVFEALTGSCMVLFTETYGRYCYQDTNHKHEHCSIKEGLCHGCSVFGTILGDETLLQGKLRFSDAVGQISSLEKGEWTLKELSSPKPDRHIPFYAKDGSTPASGPKGRKFYYHHNPIEVSKPDYIGQNEPSHRNANILERFMSGSDLMASMHFQSLSEEQLASILYALELEYTIEKRDGKAIIKRQLAHKIGMGKSLGLGSLGIFISGGRIEKGASRYHSFEQRKAENLRVQIDCLRKQVSSSPSDELRNLLSLSKYEEGSIEYPKYSWFINNKQKPLGIWGEYEGTTSDPNEPIPIVSTTAALSPGVVKNGRIVEITNDSLIIETEDGRRYQRRKAIQGVKADKMAVGLEVSLRGNAVFPISKMLK